MLKYQNKFQMMDVIKAFDHMPRQGELDIYVVGRVMAATGAGHPGYGHYEIEVIATSHGQYDLDEIVRVPYEIGFEHEDRVTLWPDQALWTDKGIREQVRDDIEAQQVDIKHEAVA